MGRRGRQPPKVRSLRILAFLTAASASLTLLVAAASGAYHVYVTNAGDMTHQPSLSEFSATGAALTPIGTLTAAGADVIAPSADGTHVYVTNDAPAGKLTSYKLASNGTLSFAGSVNTGPHPEGIAVAPDGSHVYVASGSVSDTQHIVSIFSVGSGGQLSADGSATVSTGLEEASLTLGMTPDGRHLYVENGAGSGPNHPSIAVFTVAANGSLTRDSAAEFLIAHPAEDFATTPDGRFLYVSSAGAPVYELTVANDGSLAQIGTLIGPSEPVGLAVSPDGGLLYVADATGAGVWSYTINADGSLTGTNPPKAAAPMNGGIRAVALLPDYSAAFATGLVDLVAEFSVGAGGVLSPTSNPPSKPTGTDSAWLVAASAPGPSASFTATPATAGSASSFDASASTDPDATIVYAWDFGDGSAPVISASPKTTHAYAAAGNYTVTLT
jgi:6-phosphogluconolactonase (cycloisomerase 2 family)